jgi:hypothetical protein
MRTETKVRDFRVSTGHGGLRAMFEIYLPGAYDKLDVPKELEDVLHLPNVRLVLDGKLPKTFYRRKPENQLELAMMVMNTFRLLIHDRAHAEMGNHDYERNKRDHYRKVDKKDVLEVISANVCEFMHRIDVGISWVALRQAVGRERELNFGDRGEMMAWIRFIASRKRWMAWVNKVRGSKVYQESKS